MAEANWIKLNRKIWDCFIWSFENPQYTLAWIDMLLLANYKDKRIMFDGVIETVSRGSFITSMVKLSERWHMNRKTVKRFLDILQEDGMITYECTRRRTSITIVNYDQFQSALGDESKVQEPGKNDPNKGAADGTTESIVETIENTGFAGFDIPPDGQLNGQANGQPTGQPDGQQEHNSLDISGTTLWTQHKKVKNIKENKESKEGKEDSKGDFSDGKHPDPTPSVPYETVKNLYNDICKSLPRCTLLSDARKKAIKARMSSGYTLEHFKTVFTKAEASSFLTGKNDRNWRANIDWLFLDSKMARVLEGYYDDAEGSKQPIKQPEQKFQSSGNVFLDILKGGEYV